jgi:hypothetical protein
VDKEAELGLTPPLHAGILLGGGFLPDGIGLDDFNRDSIDRKIGRFLSDQTGGAGY